jgi:predicted ATPase
LLLVNYRTEYAHRWGSKTAYSQLRLDTLNAESTAELLAALLGPDPGLVPLTQMLVKRGNPFFLEEAVRTLVETGTTRRSRSVLPSRSWFSRSSRSRASTSSRRRSVLHGDCL